MRALEKLYNAIDDPTFETLVLLYMARDDQTVIASDVSTSGKVKYYDLWNSHTGTLSLLAVSFDAVPLSERSMEAMNPGYDFYICTQPAYSEKWLLLEWLFTEPEERIPPFLRELKKQTDRLEIVFGDPYEKSNYAIYFPEEA